MSRELEVQAIRLIAHLAEEGSLGAAARRMGVSQPAASSLLRAFETRWQLRLAERSPRGTRLTDDGETVAVWARDLLGRIDSMREGLGALSSERRTTGSTLGIAASLTIAEFVLPSWIGDLRTACPGVHPRLRVVNSEVVAELIWADECHIGFIETRALPTGLSGDEIGTDRLAVVVRPEHPWTRRRRALTVEELRASEFVLREEGSGTRETFNQALGLEAQVAMIATSTTAMVGAALAGVAPAVVSHLAVGPAIERGDLVEVRHDLDLVRPLTAVWRPGQTLSGAAAQLLTIARRARANSGGGRRLPTEVEV